MSCTLSPCPECPRVRIPVPGEGPLDAEIAAIAEAPSYDEDKKGRPFIGRFGKEMDGLYWPLAGLNRNNIYITNAIKCYPRNDRDASTEILMSCAGLHLKWELQALRQLKLVILMGAAACSLVGLEVDMLHGRFRKVDLFGREILAFISYHPAAGSHDHNMMQVIMEDWGVLRAFLETGEYEEPKDEYPNPVYLRRHTAEQVRATFHGVDPDESLAMDTEYDPLPVGVDPYCLTYTLIPGTGYLIKAEDREALDELAALTADACVGSGRMLGGYPPPQFKDGTRRKRRRGTTGWRGQVLMHNATADLPPVAAMGVPIDARRVVDTMSLSFNLCTTPQGLKQLAYRLVGMEMVEFHDLVTPYAVEYWLAYMEMLATRVWPKPEPYMRMVPENLMEDDGHGRLMAVGKHMVEKLYKPQGLTTKVKRLLTDYRKAPGPKVFKRWWDWEDEEKAPAIAKFGEMPRMSIRMVSDERALLDYACRDSDATKRGERKLFKLRRQFRRKYNV